MTLPTDQEMQSAYDAITKDGPAADTTLRLGLFVMRNPQLRQWLDLVHGVSVLDRAVLQSALMTGLNYGLRIAEMRGRKD